MFNMKALNLRDALVQCGWSRLDARTNPLAYTDSSGKRFGTLMRDQARISLSSGLELIEERGRAIAYFSDDEKSVILNALIVDCDERRRGLAKSALHELVCQADLSQTKLFLEPTPIYDQPVSREILIKLYADFGFNFSNGNCVVMARDPKSK